jgi:1-acyl-sn-glycerol-3-phosphate acyltransferase
VNADQRTSTAEEMERRFIVRGGKWFTRAYATYFHNLELLTPCPIPAQGGGILACNHTSGLDPVMLQAACPRVIIWMMAREFRNLFGLRWFLDAIEPIAVERSGRDMAATRAALRALKDGKILGVFPEGRIEPHHQLLEFQTGVALLASKSGVPVYPAYLDGTQRQKGMLESFIRPNHVTLAFGPPIRLADAEGRDGMAAATGQVRTAVERLAGLKPSSAT